MWTRRRSRRSRTAGIGADRVGIVRRRPVVWWAVLLAGGGGLYLLLRDLPPPEDADLRPRMGRPAGEEALCRRVPESADSEWAERMMAAAPERPALLPAEGVARAVSLRCLLQAARLLAARADETGDGDVYGLLVRVGRRVQTEAQGIPEWVVGQRIILSVLEREERRQRAGPERLLRELEGPPDPRASLAEAVRREYVRDVGLLEEVRRDMEGTPWPLRLFYRHGRTRRLLADLFRAILRDLEGGSVSEAERAGWEARCRPRWPVGGVLNFFGRSLIGTLCPNREAVSDLLRRQEAWMARLQAEVAGGGKP